MTAYTNPEKEHGYNVRHAWGREGHGKGIGKIWIFEISKFTNFFTSLNFVFQVIRSYGGFVQNLITNWLR